MFRRKDPEGQLHVSPVVQQAGDFFYGTGAEAVTTAGGTMTKASEGGSPSSGLMATQAGGRATIGGPFT
jgi:hypothetical protein